jgi:hypothetical protein
LPEAFRCRDKVWGAGFHFPQVLITVKIDSPRKVIAAAFMSSHYDRLAEGDIFCAVFKGGSAAYDYAGHE